MTLSVIVIADLNLFSFFRDDITPLPKRGSIFGFGDQDNVIRVKSALVFGD